MGNLNIKKLHSIQGKKFSIEDIDNFEQDYDLHLSIANNEKNGEHEYGTDTVFVSFGEDEDYFGEFVGNEEDGYEFVLSDEDMEFKNGGKMKNGGSVSDTPKVYIADLAAYNEGKLIGEWIDLSDFSDGEEVMSKIQELIEKWSEEQNVEREEYAVHDYENFPKSIYSEYMGEDDFQSVIDYWEAIKNSDYPEEVVEDYMSYKGMSDFSEAISDMENSYYGKFEDIEDFASNWVDGAGMPSNPEYYIYISETDRRLVANEQADFEVGDMSDEDLVERADMKEEYDEAEEDGDDDKMNEIIEKAKEKIIDEIYNEWYDGLNDPYDFLVNEHGLYDEKSLMDANFIQFDYEKFGKDLEQDYHVIEHDGEVYVFDLHYKKGGSIKQKNPQYKRDKYGSQDKKRIAKPVGFRYKKIRDKKSGRLREVTKDDKEYYKTPSQKLIKEYKDGDKSARKMLYFENRADHSDKEPLRTLRKYAKGGNVTIGDEKARYKVKYKDGDDFKEGFLVELISSDDSGVAVYKLYTKSKKFVKQMSLKEGQELVSKGDIVRLKTYDIEPVYEESNKDVVDMDYSERRRWINEEVVPFIKSAVLYWNSYGGDSYDFNNPKEEKRFIEDARAEADYKTEKSFKKFSPFKVTEDGWYIETKTGEQLEEVSSDNTYNWNYLGIITWNFRIFKANEDRYFLMAMPHLGGDVRGNYGEALFFEGESEEEVMYKFREIIIDGGRGIRIEFKDDSTLSFDAQQDSDVDYFELNMNSKTPNKSKAKMVLDIFEKFGSWKGDEFLTAIVEEFNEGNKYAKGGGVDAKIPDSSKFNEIIDKYNRLVLPKTVFLKGKKYVGEASIVNGYNGYESSPQDGLLGVFETVGKGQNIWNGFKGYLQDENGAYLRAKQRRGQIIDIEKGKTYSNGGGVGETKSDKKTGLDFQSEFPQDEMDLIREDVMNYVADMVEQGYRSGELIGEEPYYRGWFEVSIEEDENDEGVRNEEVAKNIRNGNTSGYYPTYTFSANVWNEDRKYAKGGNVNKTIKFYDLVDEISGLEYDGDPTDLRLHSDERFSFGANRESEYNEAIKEIDDINYKGNGWEIYASYDVSGYDYWMKNMEERNYITITVSFDKEDVDRNEIEKIDKAMSDAIQDAGYIDNKYDYMPNSDEGVVPSSISDVGLELDNVEENEDGTYWTQLCDEHGKIAEDSSEGSLDDTGSGICGVVGCQKEATYYFDFNKMRKGGKVKSTKQGKPQYKRDKYGSQDTKRIAKPVGFRYKKIRDKKSGRLRDVTKDDKEYYQTPTQKLIKAYEDGDKAARKMIYFEKRADHSDKEPLKSIRKYRDGGKISYSLIEASNPEYGIVIDTGWSADDFRDYLKVRRKVNKTARFYPDSSEVGFFISDDTGTCWGLVPSDFKIGEKYPLPKN